MGLKTLRKEIITFSVDTQNEIDPTAHTFKIGPGNDIMFGLWVTGVPLNQGPKLFDILFLQSHLVKATDTTNATEIPFVPCTPEHFNFNS